MSAQITLTIEAKVLGQRKPLLSPWQVAVPRSASAGQRTTLRDLLAAVVAGEVEAFQQRQRQRRLARVLSPDQIADAAVRGKIAMGGDDLAQEVTAGEALATALQGFEDRLYFVFLDGAPVEALDQQITLREQSHLLFVRLVALVGG